jgi:hypothetical protein
MIFLAIFLGAVGVTLPVIACSGPFCYNNEGPLLFWIGILMLAVAAVLGYQTL